MGMFARCLLSKHDVLLLVMCLPSPRITSRKHDGDWVLCRPDRQRARLFLNPKLLVAGSNCPVAGSGAEPSHFARTACNRSTISRQRHPFNGWLLWQVTWVSVYLFAGLLVLLVLVQREMSPYLT